MFALIISLPEIPFAGVTKGTGCFCSNDVDQAEKTDEENCMAPCEGNPFIRCGGFESVAVYNKTGPQI